MVCDVIAAGLLLIALAMSHPIQAYAQELPESLKPQYVSDDLEGLASLIQLLPFEAQDVETLKVALRGNWHVEETELGFGGKYLELVKGHGYSRGHVYALLYNGRVAHYVVGVEGDSHWPSIRKRIVDRWRDLSGPEVSEEGHGLIFRRTMPQVLRAYQLNVAGSLGSMKEVSVPPALRGTYSALIDPMANTAISGTSGDDGIAALVEFNEADLLENVLRGYNPGARVMAALALRDLERSGARLSSITRQSIDKVLNLNIELHACVFDICSNLTAREALRWFGSDRAFPVPNTAGDKRKQ